jgi:hypothetical protein
MVSNNTVGVDDHSHMGWDVAEEINEGFDVIIRWDSEETMTQLFFGFAVGVCVVGTSLVYFGQEEFYLGFGVGYHLGAALPGEEDEGGKWGVL